MLNFGKLFFEFDLFSRGKAVTYKNTVCALSEIFKKDILSLPCFDVLGKVIKHIVLNPRI